MISLLALLPETGKFKFFCPIIPVWEIPFPEDIV